MARIRVNLCDIEEINTYNEKLEDIIYKLITMKMLEEEKEN